VKIPIVRRQRSTKIVATLGPATSDDAKVEALFLAGVDLFRLNFSHGSHEGHGTNVERIRRVERHYAHPIGIMVDLQGPKLRLGNFADGPVRLELGQRFRLDLTAEPGNAERVGLPHPEIFQAIDAGTELLVDDGKMRLKVERAGAGFA
jgi:pyruvate kinase